MPDRSQGDAAQIRLIGEQIGDAVISKFVSEHPELRQASVTHEIPPPLKWAAIIFSAVMTLIATGGLIWLVTTVSEMSVTVARLDERMLNYTNAQALRMDEIERRTTALEQYHRDGGGDR